MMSLSIMVTFSIFLILISLWIRWRKHKLSLFKRYGIPGPKPNFIFGNLLEYNRGRNEFIKEWLKQSGKMFGFYLGAKPYLVCADVEFLKICQIKDVHHFYNRDMGLSDSGIPHDSAFNMLGNLKDKNWKNVRSILSTCFTTGKIKAMSKLMSPPIRIFLKNIEKQGEKPFNIAELCKTLTFDIIATSAFGVNTNVQNNENNQFIKSVHAVFRLDSSNILAGISVCFPELESICTFIRHRIDSLKHMLNLPAVCVIYETCRNIIESRKKSTHHHRQDLLQTLIDAEAEDEEDEAIITMKKLPENYVIANALLFMAAGYDTTSVTLMWCIHFLARNCEIQENVRREIRNGVNDKMEIQYSDLSNFQLLDQVILETLRFWPFSFLTVNRICSKDYHYKGMTIPQGCRVAIPLPILQNDPEVWNDPDKFDPDRFSSINRGKINSIVYQPFGAGRRICLAERFAKTVIKLVLANLLRSFQLEYYGDEKVELEYALHIHQPKNGIIVKAIQLNS